ncbi:MAG: thiamine pyrophosphate-dependent enzyme [Micromonosporaceae bacterium]
MRELPEITVRDASHDVLLRAGVKIMTGNAGSSELPVLANLPNDLTYIPVLQESVAVAIADGYAQLAGDPVAVLLHAAAGLGNAAGQIVNAARSGSPLVLLVGRQHRTLLTGAPFVDSYGLELRELIKRAYAPQRAADAPELLAQACHLAQLPPRGPVLVTVPADDWLATAGPYTVKPKPVAAHPDQRVLGELASALLKARSPAFVVGAEVDREHAVQAMMDVADAVCADVWHAPMSWRRSAHETHPRFKGHLPPAPTKAAKALEDSGYDLVIAFGTVDTYHTPPENGLMPPMPYRWVVSDAPDVLARTPGVSILGDVGAALHVLSGMFSGIVRPAPTAPRAGHPPTSATGQVYHAIRQVLPDAILAEEAPAARPDLHAHHPIDSVHGGGYYTPAAGTLGGGLAGSIGIALARPDQQVVAVVGDGSAMYTIQALWTAAQVSPRLVIVVLDNRGYETMRSVARHIDAGNLPGLDIHGLNWPHLAAGFGVPARTVDAMGDLREALRAAEAADGAFLIHVPIS